VAINYTNLFNDLKEVYSAIEGVDTFFAAMVAERASIISQLEATGVTTLITDVNTAYDNIESLCSGIYSNLSSIASKRLLDRVTVLNELNQPVNASMSEVLTYLHKDMVDNSQTIDKSTVSASVTDVVKTNANAGTVVTTLKLPGNKTPGDRKITNRYTYNKDTELPNADTLALICTSDSQQSGADGNATFSGRGLNFKESLHPLAISTGNYGTMTLRPIQFNSLIDNFFEDFSGNVPIGWTASNSANYANETVVVTPAFGTSSLKIVGNGTLTYELTDDVQPRQVLCLCIYARKVTGAAGTVTVVVNVNGSPAGTITINAGNTTDSGWTRFTTTVPIGAVLGTVELVVTSATITGGYYLDGGALAEYAYFGGVGVALVQGTANFIVDDLIHVDITNNGAGKLQRMFNKCFGTQMPSSGTPTIADP
jgi:hypothetical protein